MALYSRLRLDRFHWFLDHAGSTLEGSPRQGRALAYRAIESGGNNYLIVFVAGLGFFTDSYILFASNAITPMLGYIYWNDATGPSHEIAINTVTLSGCIFGMLLFGWLGDRYGRRKMYGYELILLVIGTVGVIMSSVGYTPAYVGDGTHVDWGTFGSMDIFSWLLFWRFVTGVGIGGDYPLSAVIVSEFAPTKRRARMLAAVFSMQAFGYAAASIVSLIVLTIVRSYHPDPSPKSIDQVWRWVMGLGLIPACFAIILRLTIPESPRYTLDVHQNVEKAFDEVNRFNNTELRREWDNLLKVELIQDSGTSTAEAEEVKTGTTTRAQAADETSTALTVRNYFFKDKYWTVLAGTSLTWFVLDIAFYALSLNSPSTIAKIWYKAAPSGAKPRVWDTDTDVSDPEMGIYTILMQNSIHSLIISSIGAIVGGAAMILAIDRFNRKNLQLVMFVVLAFLFIVTGATFSKTVNTDFHGVTITLYCLCQLCFYFGPNTLTFIIPAELFPTKYRATCHGISAASGKLGSIIIQIFLAYVKFGGQDSGSVTPDHTPSQWLGWVLLICALPMFLGALVTYFWIPKLQNRDLSNIPLEKLAYVKAIQEEEE